MSGFKMTLARTTWLPEDDPRIETCRSDFKYFNVKFYVSALVGVIIKVILQDARCDNKDIHFILNTFFFSKNCDIYEKMLKNILERDRLQMTIWRMRALHAGYLRL